MPAACILELSRGSKQTSIYVLAPRETPKSVSVYELQEDLRISVTHLSVKGSL